MRSVAETSHQDESLGLMKILFELNETNLQHQLVSDFEMSETRMPERLYSRETTERR